MESSRHFLSDLTNTTETNSPDKRMSLEIDDSDSQEPCLKLRQQSWAEGMGWFTQKTIVLDFAETTILAAELAQAVIEMKMVRSQTNHPKAQPAKELTQETRVLEFPRKHPANTESKPVKAEETETARLVQFRPSHKFQ